MKWPLLRIDIPCNVLRASALLCWALLSRWRALFLLSAAAAAPGPRMSNLPTRSLAWNNSLKKSFKSDQDDFGTSCVTTTEYHVLSRPLSAPFLISHTQAGSTTCEGKWSSTCLSLTITFASAWTSSWDFSPLIQVYSIRVSNLAQKICSKSLSGATKTTSGHHMWQHKSLTCDREWSSCLSLKYCTCYCYAKERYSLSIIHVLILILIFDIHQLTGALFWGS